MEKKAYYILPRDSYGQYDGNVNEVALTDDEYKERKECGEVITDNYMSALYRSQN